MIARGRTLALSPVRVWSAELLTCQRATIRARCFFGLSGSVLPAKNQRAIFSLNNAHFANSVRTEFGACGPIFATAVFSVIRCLARDSCRHGQLQLLKPCTVNSAFPPSKHCTAPAESVATRPGLPAFLSPGPEDGGA